MNNFLKQNFIHFLKQNNVHERFMYNFDHRHELFYEFQKINFKPYFEESIKHTLILHAFDWTSTSEGYRFWHEIHIKWLKYIK